MTILAIDPGPTESAWVVWDGKPLGFRKEPNQEFLAKIRNERENPAICENPGSPSRCVIEQVSSYGMPVGAEVFETVFWSGRFAEAFGADHVHRITRLKVKMHLCHDSRAKDGNIRQALIDRFGKPGTKKAPGILYGVSGDVWSAIALAVTWEDLHATG